MRKAIIIHDEKYLRLKFRIILRELKYQVSTFVSAAEWLEGKHSIKRDEIKRDKGPHSCPCCDLLVVSAAAGKEAMQELKHRDCQIPKILVTGPRDNLFNIAFVKNKSQE